MQVLKLQWEGSVRPSGLVRLCALVSAALGAHVCSAHNADQRVHNALVRLAQSPQSVPIAVRYRVCPKALDEGYELDVSIPLVVHYAPPAADKVVVTTSVGSVELILHLTSISVGDTPPAFTDQNSTGLQLDAAQASEITKLLGHQADALKAFLSGAGGSQALGEGLMGSFSASIQNVLNAQGDTRSVRARSATEPGTLNWPALELCAGSIPVITLTNQPRDEQLRARGAFPVGESPQAQRVTQILKNAAGKPIAYREVEVQLATPPGTFSVNRAPPTNQTPQGPSGVKIVNGVIVQDGEMPWSVAFAMRGVDGRLVTFCGGTVVADSWVLTAAHCRIDERSIVVLGRVNVNGSGGFERGVKTVWRHINFAKAERYDSDLSLVELTESVNVQPIELLPQPVAALMPVTVVGWGATEEGGESVPLLHSVELDVVADATCKFAYRNEPTRVSDSMVCANRPRKDACQGDSGGALLRLGRSNAWQIAGIVSFGKGCASPSFPGVYTKLAAFSGWVNEVEVAARSNSQ